MSGSGSSGGVYEGGTTPCESLDVETALASPDPTVKVSKGDVLAVRIEKGKVPIAVCATKDDKIAGSLAFGAVRQLIGCMEQGHEYIATVKSVDGGRRVVRITHK